jgi:beta-galactosidase
MTSNIPLPQREKESQLDILVEPMGRINFGPEVADRKGLIAPVKLGDESLQGWEIFNLPLDDNMLAGLEFRAMRASVAELAGPESVHQRAGSETGAPAFRRGNFTLQKAGDTFLDLRSWGKGDLWVNGHCPGRHWNIGPSQTAYAPGCWLHSGENQIVNMDLLGPQQPEIAGLAKPIFNEPHPEKDFRKPHVPVFNLNQGSSPPAPSGTNAPGATKP